MKIRDVMTPEVHTVGPEATLSHVASLMRDGDVGSIPVAHDDKLIGMVTDRDIAIRAVADNRPASETTVKDVMSEDLFYCFDDQECDEVARNMGEVQVRRLPVVSRDKQLVGIVSLGDVSHQATRASGQSLSAIARPEG